MVAGQSTLHGGWSASPILAYNEGSNLPGLTPGGRSEQTMSMTPDQLEAGFELFRELLAENPSLAAEEAPARAVFFAGTIPPTEEADLRSRERRFHEWFLFERSSTGSGVLPVDELIGAWSERAGSRLVAFRDNFLQSQTGVFAVTASEPGKGAWVRDLTGLGEFPLDDPELSPVIESGDLIIGRLYPIGDSLHRASPGAGVFRDPRLVQAIERDLKRLREGRSHPLLRLSQRELERMFWSGVEQPEVPEEEQSSDPVGELEVFFAEGGVQRAQVRTWCSALTRARHDPEHVIVGADGIVQAILDQVAFETDVDLDRARALILAALPRLSERGKPVGPGETAEVPEKECVASAIREFDKDRAAGIDIDASIQELERRLGIDGPAEEEEGSSVPDFPGVVGAMVEEFLWETERESGESVRRAREGLRIFGTYAKSVGVFENLASRDVLSFAAFWLPESRRLRNGAEAERLIAALDAFVRWAKDVHDVDILPETHSTSLTGLQNSLPRAVIANALLPRERETPGELFEYMGTSAEERARIRDLRGDEREVPFEPRLLAVLEEGDLFRGYTSDDGGFVVGCCYPPEAGALRQV